MIKETFGVFILESNVPGLGAGVPVFPVLLHSYLLNHTKASWDKLAGQRLPICLDQTLKQKETVIPLKMISGGLNSKLHLQKTLILDTFVPSTATY